jgi:hypothetical protein
VISTYTSYNLITRDIDKSLGRVEKQPIVARDSQYFQDNIGKITSIDDFVDDTRLFNYAMKAFGLQDMAYAKAFMKKALTEGISNPNSFANKLSDKRYVEFVKTFNFAANGPLTTTYNVARDATIGNYTARMTANGSLPLTPMHKQNTEYFKANIGDVKSLDDLMGDEKLLDYALRAFNIEGLELSRANLEKYVLGGIEDANSPANKHANENVAKFVAAFNFVKYGEDTTSHVAAKQDTVAAYLRQTLEENAGNDNEGVRLALYFERKASDVTSFYHILADPALAEVVRTVLGLPASIAQADLDKQVQMMERRLDIKDFQDPEALQKFLRRFTAMWEINNPTTTPMSAAMALFSPPTEFGISQNTLMAIALMKK